MEQRKMIDVPIGTTVRSSVRAPIDGDYEFVEHLVPSDCKPSGGDTKIYRMRGELLPPCKACGKRGIWKLAESKLEIAKDNTPYVLEKVRGDRPDVSYPSGTKR